MRNIDADAFKEKYGDYYAEEGTAEGFIGTVGQLIDDAPTVEERPKGKWSIDCQCSNCKKYVDYTTDFCPNCGAKMDMESDV